MKHKIVTDAPGKPLIQIPKVSPRLMSLSDFGKLMKKLRDDDPCLYTSLVPLYIKLHDASETVPKVMRTPTGGD